MDCLFFVPSLFDAARQDDKNKVATAKITEYTQRVLIALIYVAI